MSFVANYTLSNVAGLDKLMFNAALTGTGKIYWTEDNKLKQPFYALLNLKIAATRDVSHGKFGQRIQPIHII